MAQLGRIALKPGDQQATIAVLASFNAQDRDWIDRYNAAAKAAWEKGEQIDPTPFLAERDQLVQTTLDSLRGALSQDGWTRFTGDVQNEKKRMKISQQEANQ